MPPVSFSLADVWHTAPSLVLFVFAMIVMLAGAMARPAKLTGLWALTLVGLGLSGLAAVALYAAGPEAYDIQGMLRVDRFGLFFQLIAVTSGILATLMSEDYLERLNVRVGEYYALVLFGVMGMGLMGAATDLMMVFIALEVMSISMYILCAMNRNHAPSVESGFKYFILGAFSSALMLYGISMVYGATGHTDFTGIVHSLAGDETRQGLLSIGGALLLVGFGFKVASVPFHFWAPDVYQGAPTSVSALMSSGVKSASFAALARLLIGVFGAHSVTWAGGLWWMAAATMVVGNVGALVQRDMKRMLAYSSIAHAGYLLMALSSVAAGGEHSTALSSILFYLVAYTFMNAGAFAVLCTFTKDGADTTNLDDLAGLGKEHPLLAGSLSICLLSLAGIPPTMGFVGKFYLFTAAVQSGEVSLAMIGALAAATGVYYYLRPMVYMYMREGHPKVHITTIALAGIGLSVTATLLLGVLPSTVLTWAADSLATILGPV